MATFVQDSRSVDYTPNADVAAGDVVVQGSLVGYAPVAIPSGTLGTLWCEGVIKVGKDGADAGLTAGALVYWDATNHIATSTSSGNKLMGKMAKAAGTTDTTCYVRLQN